MAEKGRGQRGEWTRRGGFVEDSWAPSLTTTTRARSGGKRRKRGERRVEERLNRRLRTGGRIDRTTASKDR